MVLPLLLPIGAALAGGAASTLGSVAMHKLLKKLKIVGAGRHRALMQHLTHANDSLAAGIRHHMSQHIYHQRMHATTGRGHNLTKALNHFEKVKDLVGRFNPLNLDNFTKPKQLTKEAQYTILPINENKGGKKRRKRRKNQKKDEMATAGRKRRRHRKHHKKLGGVNPKGGMRRRKTGFRPKGGYRPKGGKRSVVYSPPYY
jgi:hypothetical protein